MSLDMFAPPLRRGLLKLSGDRSGFVLFDSCSVTAQQVLNPDRDKDREQRRYKERMSQDSVSTPALMPSVAAPNQNSRDSSSMPPPLPSPKKRSLPSSKQAGSSSSASGCGGVGVGVSGDTGSASGGGRMMYSESPVA